MTEKSSVAPWDHRACAPAASLAGVSCTDSPIALPNTALRSALTVADHIRRAVMTKELIKRSSGERLGRVTISIGVAALRPTDTPASLIERADGCLYAAKRSGRNRVICESDPRPRAAAKRRQRSRNAETSDARRTPQGASRIRGNAGR